MVNRNLIRTLEDEDINNTLAEMFSETDDDMPEEWAPSITQGPEFDVNNIVEGRVVRMDDEAVLVDVGFKSEGTIPLNEWEEGEEPPQIGDACAPRPFLVPGAPAATDIAAGYGHTCAVGPDGPPVCWGDNQFGQPHEHRQGPW